MSNFKFTGVNIAAALLIVSFLFPWVSLLGSSMSGFSLISNGISPGMFAYFASGLNRLFMILLIIIPLSGAIILYQNVSSNLKYDKYYKPAHIIPVLFLIVGIITLYFKMRPDTAPVVASGMGKDYDEMMGQMNRSMSDMVPGAFDVMGFGVYLALAAAIYLLLVSIGKVKDKEYYKLNASPTENKDTPPTQE